MRVSGSGVIPFFGNARHEEYATAAERAVVMFSELSAMEFGLGEFGSSLRVSATDAPQEVSKLNEQLIKSFRSLHDTISKIWQEISANEPKDPYLDVKTQASA